MALGVKFGAAVQGVVEHNDVDGCLHAGLIVLFTVITGIGAGTDELEDGDMRRVLILRERGFSSRAEKCAKP